MSKQTLHEGDRPRLTAPQRLADCTRKSPSIEAVLPRDIRRGTSHRRPPNVVFPKDFLPLVSD